LQQARGRFAIAGSGGRFGTGDFTYVILNMRKKSFACFFCGLMGCPKGQCVSAPLDDVSKTSLL
ncbi:hypothetical protein, partial [Paenibacillus odorifer]